MVSAATRRVTPGSCVGPRASSDMFMLARLGRWLRGGVLRVWCDVHDPVQVGVGGYRPGPDLRTLQGAFGSRSVRTKCCRMVAAQSSTLSQRAMLTTGYVALGSSARCKRVPRKPLAPPATAMLVSQLATKSSTISAGIEKRLIRTRGSDMAILRNWCEGSGTVPLYQYYSDYRFCAT